MVCLCCGWRRVSQLNKQPWNLPAVSASVARAWDAGMVPVEWGTPAAAKDRALQARLASGSAVSAASQAPSAIALSAANEPVPHDTAMSQTSADPAAGITQAAPAGSPVALGAGTTDTVRQC